MLRVLHLTHNLSRNKKNVLQVAASGCSVLQKVEVRSTFCNKITLKTFFLLQAERLCFAAITVARQFGHFCCSHYRSFSESRDLTIRDDAVVNENATKQRYHWLKEEK